MKSNAILQKGLAAFRERVQGFLRDGYHCSFTVEQEDLFFVKLYHKNGNRISVIFKPKTNELSQFTNGEKVFCDKVC